MKNKTQDPYAICLQKNKNSSTQFAENVVYFDITT